MQEDLCGLLKKSISLRPYFTNMKKPFKIILIVVAVVVVILTILNFSVIKYPERVEIIKQYEKEREN